MKNTFLIILLFLLSCKTTKVIVIDNILKLPEREKVEGVVKYAYNYDKTNNPELWLEESTFLNLEGNKFILSGETNLYSYLCGIDKEQRYKVDTLFESGFPEIDFPKILDDKNLYFNRVENGYVISFNFKGYGHIITNPCSNYRSALNAGTCYGIRDEQILLIGETIQITELSDNQIEQNSYEIIENFQPLYFRACH